MILETTFLIDLERELRSGAEGPAHAFLVENPGARLHVTPTILGEVAAGLVHDERQAWERFLSPFRLLAITPEASWLYGRTYRYLSDNGLLIGSNALWIAATALAHELPLVTGNEQHFRRVPGLSVLSYE